MYEGDYAREMNGTKDGLERKDVLGKTGGRRVENRSKQKFRTTRVNTEPYQAIKKATSLRREVEEPQ